ncbi:MAG: ester cyclase [Chloroflexi bacterium]|nr:ester cyclase [Chloroflexota bacterium]
MGAQENKDRFRRAFEALFNEGNLAVADELFDPNFLGHAPPNPIRGPQGLKQTVDMYRKALPDLHLTIEDQIAQGDRLANRWTARGTHRGELMGIPPTGKPVTLTGITINRWAGGKIVEGWTEINLMGVMQQLGVVPAPGARA